MINRLDQIGITIPSSLLMASLAILDLAPWALAALLLLSSLYALVTWFHPGSTWGGRNIMIFGWSSYSVMLV